jgi:hypothetical protein
MHGGTCEVREHVNASTAMAVMMQPDCNQQPTRFRTGAARNTAGALTAEEIRRC